MVTNLRVIGQPTATEEIKASVIARLEQTLEEARRGDVTEVLMLVQHANPDVWSERSGQLTNLMTWCGRLGAVQLTLQLQNREDDYE
jgi:hypothetical protein